MKAIIIAAGMGNRMGALTKDSPKCMLKAGKTTLLENVIARLKHENVTEIGIIVGHQADKIKIPNVTYFSNPEYQTNNILHSLMHAKAFMNDDVIISYSDIWLEQTPISQLVHAKGDCVISVDKDWQNNYIDRTDHPVSEAENVIYDDNGYALALGKHLQQPKLDAGHHIGEFIGLCKISKAFCQEFIQIFDELNQTLDKTSPFQRSKTWINAYLTDFFNELIVREIAVNCSFHSNGWQEIDTLQDYQRLQSNLMGNLSYAL